MVTEQIVRRILRSSNQSESAERGWFIQGAKYYLLCDPVFRETARSETPGPCLRVAGGDLEALVPSPWWEGAWWGQLGPSCGCSQVTSSLCPLLRG